MTRIDAVVALSGEFSPAGEMGPNTKARMDTAIELIDEGVSDNLIVTGDHSFAEPRPISPLSHLMAAYAVDEGVDRVFVEDRALETVGNALFTQELAEAYNWRNLIVVTNKFHLPRSLRIFNHVMGEGYDIHGCPAPDKSFPHQRLHETAADILTRLILARTEPGDVDAIRKRLFAIVPGYVDIPTTKRIGAALSVIAGV